MSTALFVFSANSHFWEAFPLVAKFRDEGWRVAVLFEWADQEALDSSAKCAALGCDVVEVPPALAYPGAGPTVAAPEIESESEPEVNIPAAALPGKAPPKWRLGVVSRLVFFLLQLWRMMVVRAYGRRVVDEIAPTAVLTGPFNSLAYPANGIVRAARTRGIPLFCYPWGPILGEKAVIAGRFFNYRAGSFDAPMAPDDDIINALCARLLPHWLRERDGVRLFCRDPLSTIAARLTGLMDHDGWQKPGLSYTKTFVPNARSAALLEDSNYPMDKVVVSGMPRYDAIVRRRTDPELNRHFWATLGLSENQPFILMNVEPSLEHKYAPERVHWDNFNATLDALKLAGVPIVLSLHPLCNYQNYAFAEDKHGVRISQHYGIFDLMSECRLYVSYPCSTNDAAAIFCKPIFIVDYHGVIDGDAGYLFKQDTATYCRSYQELAQAVTAFACDIDADAQSGAPLQSSSDLIFRIVAEASVGAAG